MDIREFESVADYTSKHVPLAIPQKLTKKKDNKIPIQNIYEDDLDD